MRNSSLGYFETTVQ